MHELAREKDSEMVEGHLRETLRKRLVMKFLEGEIEETSFIREKKSRAPWLLEELRWEVLAWERSRKQLDTEEPMHPSYKKSFARTIREHMPDVIIHKLQRPDEIHSGIVTRAALFRLEEQDDIEEFLRREKKVVIGTYVPDAGPNHSRRPVVKCDFHVFRLHHELYEHEHLKEVLQALQTLEDRGYRWQLLAGLAKDPKRVMLPVSQPLTLVALSPVTSEDLVKIADVPWPIYRGTGTLLKSTESIRTRWRPYRNKKWMENGTSRENERD